MRSAPAAAAAAVGGTSGGSRISQGPAYIRHRVTPPLHYTPPPAGVVLIYGGIFYFWLLVLSQRTSRLPVTRDGG